MILKVRFLKLLLRAIYSLEYKWVKITWIHYWQEKDSLILAIWKHKAIVVCSNPLHPYIVLYDLMEWQQNVQDRFYFFAIYSYNFFLIKRTEIDSNSTRYTNKPFPPMPHPPLHPSKPNPPPNVPNSKLGEPNGAYPNIKP